MTALARPITERAGRTRERILLGVLATASVSLALGYAAALIHLLVQGGAKVVSFTSYATPLEGIEGEDRMRFVLAAVFFAPSLVTGSYPENSPSDSSVSLKSSGRMSAALV